MEKYYTPEISEFHIGFECYLLGMIGEEDGTEKFHRKKIIFTEEDFNPTHCRVIEAKYLDRTDIKELGWRLHPNKKDEEIYKLDHYTLEFSTNPMGEKFSIIWFITPKDVRFKGFLKNKSELSRVMKQLQII